MVTNDGMAALRAYYERPGTSRKPARRVHNQASFRSRRTTPPTGQGRWALQGAAFAPEQDAARATEWRHAIAQQLLNRYGVVFRETAHAENLPGGFSAVYDVLKAMEESGKIRRGYFAADLGATQFAMPAAVDLLRSLREGGRAQTDPDRLEIVQLAATDPANPYGALMRWPAAADAASSLTRSVGARVILCNGALVAYLRRGNPNIQVFLPEEEPQRSNIAKALAVFFVEHVHRRDEEADPRGGILISTINGLAVSEHWMARFLLDAGFSPGGMGFNVRRGLHPLTGARSESRANA
jgi:ATP-dependent Lhr-like helicase